MDKYIAIHLLRCEDIYQNKQTLTQNEETYLFEIFFDQTILKKLNEIWASQ